MFPGALGDEVVVSRTFYISKWPEVVSFLLLLLLYLWEGDDEREREALGW